MPLNTDELKEIEAILASGSAEIEAIQAVKSRFPDLKVTRCDASDVIEEPFSCAGDFEIHLLDSRDHCAQIVADVGQATGLVLARRSER